MLTSAFFLQLLSYHPLSWLAFIASAYLCSRYIPWGILFGHIIVAMIVMYLDVAWIQSEMHQPGWNGVPDQDIVFSFGVFARIILINTVLLPVSLLGGTLRHWRLKAQTAATATVL